MTSSTLTAEELCTGLESLPQELYNEVYELTFAYNGGFVIMNEDYKPPALLQIDRESRKKFTDQYYGPTSHWILGPRKWKAYNILQPWFDLLPNDAFSMLVDNMKANHDKKYQRLFQNGVRQPLCYGFGVAGKLNYKRNGAWLATRLVHSIDFDDSWEVYVVQYPYEPGMGMER